MTENESENIVTSFSKEIRKRSFICHVIQTMALTYFLIFAFLFLAGLLYSETITKSIGPYYSIEGDFHFNFRWFIILGTLLFFIASAGIILFMLKRKAGFFIFLASVVAIMILDLIFLDFDWLRYLILSGFIFLLGIAHFSRRCYR